MIAIKTLHCVINFWPKVAPAVILPGFGHHCYGSFQRDFFVLQDSMMIVVVMTMMVPWWLGFGSHCYGCIQQDFSDGDGDYDLTMTVTVMVMVMMMMTMAMIMMMMTVMWNSKMQQGWEVQYRRRSTINQLGFPFKVKDYNPLKKILDWGSKSLF